MILRAEKKIIRKGITVEKINENTPIAISGKSGELVLKKDSINIHTMNGSTKRMLMIETTIMERESILSFLNVKYKNKTREMINPIEAARYKSKGSIVISEENGSKAIIPVPIKQMIIIGPPRNAKIPENALKSHALNGWFSSLTARYFIFIHINHSAAGRPRQQQ